MSLRLVGPFNSFRFKSVLSYALSSNIAPKQNAYMHLKTILRSIWLQRIFAVKFKLNQVQLKEKMRVLTERVTQLPLQERERIAQLSNPEISAFLSSIMKEVIQTGNSQNNTVSWEKRMSDLANSLDLTVLDVKALFDLSEPHEWYPNARMMKRKIVIHAGPTNSGKTHAAMLQLQKSNSGIYCSPLRMLAGETFNRLNARGVPCSLVTGQEIINKPGALHTSCTIEMCQLDSRVEVAVLDEMQMIGDPERGSNWTRCLLGLCANEIHVCGDDSMVKIVSDLAELTGDECIVHTYNRLMPLEMDDSPILSAMEIQSGDCIIAFSRLELFRLKKQIESSTKHKCCLIYGALPTETRQNQADLFNSRGSSGFDVLVATNAIGMGLNLFIRRILFSTVEKRNALNKIVQITASEVKQIAGRAGRFGTSNLPGVVSTIVTNRKVKLATNNFQYVQSSLKQNLEPLKFVAVLPSLEFVQNILFRINHSSLKAIMSKSSDHHKFTRSKHSIGTVLPNLPTSTYSSDFVVADLDNYFLPPPLHPSIKSEYSYDELFCKSFYSNLKYKDNKSVLPNSLIDVFKMYEKFANMDHLYFMGYSGNITTSLEIIADLPMTIGDRFVAAFAPVRESIAPAFYQFTEQLCYDKYDCVQLKLGVHEKLTVAKSILALLDLENLHMNYRKQFSDFNSVLKLKQQTSALIDDSLLEISNSNHSNELAKNL